MQLLRIKISAHWCYIGYCFSLFQDYGKNLYVILLLLWYLYLNNIPIRKAGPQKNDCDYASCATHNIESTNVLIENLDNKSFCKYYNEFDYD
jgi:hypothetical protein